MRSWISSLGCTPLSVAPVTVTLDDTLEEAELEACRVEIVGRAKAVDVAARKIAVSCLVDSMMADRF